MAAPSLTYTLTNGTTADASQVQQNFTDLLNGYTDGTKDLSISALTCAGTATLNGHVNLGNSSADDLTITASLASDIAVKTTGTYNIGGASTGLLSIYLAASADADTARIVAAAHSADRTYTIPDAGAAATFMLNPGTTGDSNLGTISSVTFDKYYEGSFTATFDTGMYTTGSAVAMTYRKIGKTVTLFFPATLVTANATAGSWETSGTPIPSGLRPAVQTLAWGNSMNNGNNDFTPGLVIINTNGSIDFFRSGVTASAANWTNGTANCGFNNFFVTYFVA